MRRVIRKLVSISCSAVIGISALTGCAGGNHDTPPSEENTDLSYTYAFVGKDIHNPYMQSVYEGFETACRETGAQAVYKSPKVTTSEKQAEIIESLIEQKVSGIAVAANDEDALESVLQQAMNLGIKIISFDSAVNKDSRQTHIQQTNPEQTGRELIRTAYEIVGGNGGIAILSSTNQSTNQNLWIDYMNKEISENPEKYANTPIIEIAYGDDDLTKSISQTQALLHNPDIKIIVAPTAVGILAAAQVLQESGSEVKLTGLGMPSQMAPYIEDGTCPVMYLWNPVNIGYLAGYTLDALVSNKITGAAGETFTAGTLGEKTITSDTENGSEVVLGDLLKFDAENISEWKDVY